MGFLIGLLTFFLVVDCLLLMLLILIQLPKKEAGIGTAFGGGATDALFGAGTGTALTQLTKYAAVVFFALSIVLALLNGRAARQNATGLMQALQKQAAKPAPAPTPAPGNLLNLAPITGTSNLMSLPANSPAPTPTPAPAHRPPAERGRTNPAAAPPVKSGK